jgi:hypothetical protein
MKRMKNSIMFAVTATVISLAVSRAAAETVVWSENFDDGLANNRWAADNGTWQIGSPTFGPTTNASGSRANSGTNCITTGLNGNYGNNVNSRIFLLPNVAFTVPPTNQNPRLRFWHWINSQAGFDYGYVEVKPVGSNTWTTISTNYSGTSSGVWTRPSLDLSKFAGQTVQLAFHFISDGCCTVAPGWYVEDIALVTGTPVFNSPEGFESGLGDWTVDNGTWQVGKPTSGPPTNNLGLRAYSGTNCAATVLGGNYDNSVDSRLISAAFSIPPTNQNPRLRFWHWFNSQADADYGYVEVKPLGSNTWTTISLNYSGTSSGVWTRPSLDLSQFAGQTVQLAFHFISDGCCTVAPGWYVDDITLVTGTPVFNSPEGFESGLGDWTVDNGTWQVGKPTSGPGAAYAGTNCAATVLGGNYDNSVDSRMISAAFIVPPANQFPLLRFTHWFNTQLGADIGVVEIKPVGSNNWTAISSSYSGSSGGWTSPALDISQFGGQKVQMAFHFTSDGCCTVGPGWYVDEVNIVNYVSPPLINTYPTNQTVNLENPVTFVVGASGAGTLTYQWQFNNVAIPGATNTSYFIPSAQLTNGGNYSVTVSNIGGITYSPTALLTVLPLPGSLTNEVIDPVTAPGTVGYTNGVFTITGSGEDIENTADAFQFVHQTLIGDGQIVARVTSLVAADVGAEAGVMIREGLDSGSKHAFLRVNSQTNVVFRRRLATDDYSRDTAYAPTNHAWLRLTRMGNTFIGHSSTNGTDWEYVWFTTVNMSNQVQIGLAVTAHQNGSFATAKLDNVAISSLSPLPGVWPLAGPKMLIGGEAGGYSEFQRVGGFKFLLAGVAGEYENIKVSTNVVTPIASWSSLATVTNTYGMTPFVDVQALTNQTRYYRLQKTGP